MLAVFERRIFTDDATYCNNEDILRAVVDEDKLEEVAVPLLDEPKHESFAGFYYSKIELNKILENDLHIFWIYHV